MTETIDCGNPEPPKPVAQHKETAFERPRGVSRLEVRRGFTQAHVTDLTAPLVDARLAVLKSVAQAGASIDFLKFTPSGLSFLAPDDQSTVLATALKACGVGHSIQTGRSIVSVFAVNIRDEEGLIANIVQEAIASGVRVDHVGDGHDRMLMVVATEDAPRLQNHLEKTLLSQ